MSAKQLAGLLGFLFTAAWIAFGAGDAVLCLVGAAIFYAVVAFYGSSGIDVVMVTGGFGV
jgi:hypothetical protein